MVTPGDNQINRPYQITTKQQKIFRQKSPNAKRRKIRKPTETQAQPVARVKTEEEFNSTEE